MKRLPASLLAISILFCPLLLRAEPHAHCAPYTVTRVPGDPDARRIQTAHGTTIARIPEPARTTATPKAVCRVFPDHFDFDGDTLGTEHDTILVVSGTTVTWLQMQPDFHTVTNGADSGDPNASSEFNAVLDGVNTRFDWTFTTVGKHDFFCYIHEPVMEGTVLVVAATADVKPGVIRKATFSRPPSPNPTRGDVAFAVVLPRATPVRISVHDVLGRTVATLEDGALPAGEHPYRWNGRTADGRVAGSGRYFVRLVAGSTLETRAISLVR